MKKIALAFVGALLAQSVVHAELEGYRAVDKSENANYLAAAMIGMADLSLDTGNGPCAYLPNILRNSAYAKVYVQEKSVQPAVIIELMSGATAYRALLTTDATFRKVVDVKAQTTTYKMVQVNKGTLINPEVVMERVGTPVTASCLKE